MIQTSLTLTATVNRAVAEITIRANNNALRALISEISALNTADDATITRIACMIENLDTSCDMLPLIQFVRCIRTATR